MPMFSSQSEKLEFKASHLVCGVDFGYQMVDRWYTINKVPSPFGALTMHFAPPQPSHNFQQYLSMCTMPQAPLRRKYVIFFFDSDELERLAQRRFPFNVALKNITDDMLRTLTDCEIARLKVGKGDVTFYIYAVKWRGRTFERVQELYDLLGRLSSLSDMDDSFDYSPPSSETTYRTELGLMTRGHNSEMIRGTHKDHVEEGLGLRTRGHNSEMIRGTHKDHVEEEPSQKESCRLLESYPKSRAL